VVLQGHADPRQFFNALHRLTVRRISLGDLEFGQRVWSWMESVLPHVLGEEAKTLLQTIGDEREALEGQGPAGKRLRWTLPGFFRDLFDPAVVAGFIAGAGAYRSIRALSFS